MTKFITGLAIGALLASAIPATAQRFGAIEVLSGWEVVSGSRVICRDPEVYRAAREISC